MIENHFRINQTLPEKINPTLIQTYARASHLLSTSLLLFCSPVRFEPMPENSLLLFWR